MRHTSIAVLLLLATALPPSAPDCPPDPAERYEPRSFLGYACEDDCRRHKAGFAWADGRRAASVADCGSLPPLEDQGCRAYVEEALDAEAAGQRWALENEITRPCACEGAGARFRAGCRAALDCRAAHGAPCAEAWPGDVQPFQRHWPGR